MNKMRARSRSRPLQSRSTNLNFEIFAFAFSDAVFSAPYRITVQRLELDSAILEWFESDGMNDDAIPTNFSARSASPQK